MNFENIDDRKEKTTIEISVAEYICNSINEDELKFDNKTFAKIYELVNNSLNKNTFLKLSFFKNQSDQKIVKFTFRQVNLEYIMVIKELKDVLIFLVYKLPKGSFFLEKY